MKVGIFVYFIPEGKSGGVQQYSQQLVYALSKYVDFEVVVFCSEGNKELFGRYKNNRVSVIVLPKRCKYLRMLTNNRYIRQSQFFSKLSEVMFYNKYSLKIMGWLGDYKNMIENKVDVIHFPYQALDRYSFKIPTLISLHDLQHKIYPEFFTETEIKKRDIYYKKSAELCTRIIVSFGHVRDDIVKFYKIPSGKIDVCGLGYDKNNKVNVGKFSEITRKYGIPEEYLLYPAVTWKHKNHINLINALKILHDKYGKKMHLVCTGQKTEFNFEIEKEINKLGLKDYVVFTNYLPEQEFQVLLKKAKAVVIPTLYEAESIPLIEAMAFETPVICSNATVLPEQIGNDKFVFNPNDPEDMAEKMHKIIDDAYFRDENIKNSIIQIENLSWNKKINNFVSSYKLALEDFRNK